uniref:Tumor protein p53-inducible protein 13 n=1 Tax=Knipowitschia caucasica TaxID=637954 RepID=A0AAV2J426_KNICA
MPPGQAISAVPRGVTALAALWVTVGRCLSESSWKTCDNGKVLLDADLPKDAAHRDCPTPLWPQSQRVYSVETPYNPEPAKVKCMDECISYNQTIPNSGAFRPVSAESGEYLYCPPQRWVNNLHNGATVLLYHPCSSLHERRLLSALAQSCINIFILTPHKNLDANRPIALVSWGRALEISTVVSSEICDWLERTLLTKPKAVERIYENQYNFLLIKAKNQKRLQENKGFLKQCCERAISHLPEKMKTQLHSSFRKAADGGDCQCKPNQVCECIKGAADQSHRAEVVFQSTPRTDEAVWAAGALGFILVLLTLSILHTRLYRHWRRGNSLYWHDPQQDYDSVADVIRRRLRLAKGRRKRGRKKCVVLLPSSSSSEEYP